MTRQDIPVKPVNITDKTKSPQWKKVLAKALADAKGKRGTLYGDDESLLKALK